ncbi:hypothetical protein [Hydrogenophaga sp.]|uniref:hypothetical protein n=1 Tax=Hydrogenophaga sp. TaxID=1904254 RepID=UPI0027311A9C|nr:hypothetical protein [Hydrogenophaga sp.]MDP2074602.1 hypothetical protein [Hydrogenophaga sp.]MDP3106429.1 hypothetical protein [Hydrogenophaga sp.]
MTTAKFNALAGPTARAMASVKGEHCTPPTYRPTEQVRGSMRCTKCGGTLQFTVSAINGASTGRCNSINCVRWTE